MFEQAINVGAAARVGMGTGYRGQPWNEIFEENLRDYPVLLPAWFNDAPEPLRHLRFHNGTIWRWVRPLIGFDADGAPHLRIEHRVLRWADGRSIWSPIRGCILASSATGSLGGDGPAACLLPTRATTFYAAARHGLDAELGWPGRARIKADRLLPMLAPAARSRAFGLWPDPNRGLAP